MDNDAILAELDAIRALILDIGKAFGAISTLITSQIALLPEPPKEDFSTAAAFNWEMDAVVRDKDGNMVIRNPDGSVLHRFHEIPANVG